MFILKQYKYLILTLFGLSIVILYLFYGALKPQRTLPIYNPSDISRDLVDDSIRYVRKYHTISDFSLTDQSGQQISLSNIQGKMHIADFFFTTCPGICPLLTGNMKVLQDQFIKTSDVVLLSFSVTPEKDSVPVLKSYAKEKGVIDDKWYLLTGDRKQIYDLARKSYMVVKTPFQKDDYEMIHTENFVLVDKRHRIRGMYDGTDKQSVQQLISDIAILRSE